MSDQRQPVFLCSTPARRTRVFNCDVHCSNVSKKLQAFYKEKELLDMTLISGVDNTRVGAHRVVLSASSDYFLAMFRSGLSESTTAEMRLPDVEGTILNSIIDFIYTASIELHSETVECVLKTADLFQMNSLIVACCDFMAEELDTSNCLGVALFAEQYSYSVLYEKALAFTYTHFEKVCIEKEFLQLSEEQLNKILSTNKLWAFSQERMFNRLVAWFEHDKANRENLIANILSQHVKYTLLTPKFIIINRKAVCSIPECSDMIYNWLEWHLSPETRPDGVSKKLAIISANSANNFTINVLDPDVNTWSTEIWPRPNNNRYFGSKIIMNKKLYIVGGRKDMTKSFFSTKAVECLDLQTMTWSNVSTMQYAFFSAVVAEVNGFLYIVSSHRVFMGFSFTVEKYGLGIREPFFNSQTVITNIAVVNGLIFVVCEGQTSIEYYNTATSECMQTVSRIEMSTNFGMAGVKGHLYVVGGEYNGTMSVSVQRYDPINCTWTMVRPLGLERSKIHCISLNNRLVVCGGFAGPGRTVNLVEEYNPDTNEWKSLCFMPFVRRCFDLLAV